MEDIFIPPSKEKVRAQMMEYERDVQELRRQFEEEYNKKNRNKTRAIVIVAIIIAAILGYLAVLNGRYIKTSQSVLVFDQWKGKYVTFEPHNRR